MKKNYNPEEALNRVYQSQSLINYPAIYQGFIDKGIPESDIKPRENVFTFNAWKALNRSVKKGEHGVKVVTWIETVRKEKDESGNEVEKPGKRPWTSTVFHISQTKEN